MWKLSKIAMYLGAVAICTPSHADEGGGMAAKALFYDDAVSVMCTGDKCPDKPEATKPPRPNKPAAARPPAAREAPTSIGVSYQIRMMQSDGSFRQVQPDRIFRSGERFQIIVKVNRPSYIYVDNLSPSKRLTQIYPIGSQNNYVGAMGSIVLPQGNFFEFDSEPGIEQLYILVSSTPVAERSVSYSNAEQLSVISAAKCDDVDINAGSKAIGQASGVSSGLHSTCAAISNPDIMSRQTDFTSCRSQTDYADSKAIGQSSGASVASSNIPQTACTRVTQTDTHRVLSQQESDASQPQGRYYVKEATSRGKGYDRFVIGIELMHQ